MFWLVNILTKNLNHNCNLYMSVNEMNRCLFPLEEAVWSNKHKDLTRSVINRGFICQAEINEHAQNIHGELYLNGKPAVAVW